MSPILEYRMSAAWLELIYFLVGKIELFCYCSNRFIEVLFSIRLYQCKRGAENGLENSEYVIGVFPS